MAGGDIIGTGTTVAGINVRRLTAHVGERFDDRAGRVVDPDECAGARADVRELTSQVGDAPRENHRVHFGVGHPELGVENLRRGRTCEVCQRDQAQRCDEAGGHTALSPGDPHGAPPIITVRPGGRGALFRTSGRGKANRKDANGDGELARRRCGWHLFDAARVPLPPAPEPGGGRPRPGSGF